MKRNLKRGESHRRGLEFDDIHEATLEVFWKTGVFMENEEALQIFHGGGAVIDPKAKIVRIPKCPIRDAVQSYRVKVNP